MFHFLALSPWSNLIVELFRGILNLSWTCSHLAPYISLKASDFVFVLLICSIPVFGNNELRLETWNQQVIESKSKRDCLYFFVAEFFCKVPELICDCLMLERQCYELSKVKWLKIENLETDSPTSNGWVWRLSSFTWDLLDLLLFH